MRRITRAIEKYISKKRITNFFAVEKRKIGQNQYEYTYFITKNNHEKEGQLRFQRKINKT
ncbi:hypothetical protein [Methanomethylovorans sp.]|uniref:hypothetical protein n=1 Tax=Methanomethylovorans sp. TaxID=2758717 RepID=UPI00351C4DB6